ncbi:LamG-like jellyroll fold domain-containing protein [Nonomuraea sp. NPDC050783]|uniref:LamG-like jellyroll fold domain-containing protein n=1 Tax=Nonomuraea sp. NPDC050783 TaxID=3154634 RepID=UPI003467703D
MSPTLLVHLPLDASTAQGTAADASPNHFDATFSGHPIGVLDATLGGCVQFDGVADYATLPGGDPKLRLTTYTISAWVKLRPGDRTDVVGIFWRADYRQDGRYSSLALGVQPDGTIYHAYSADPARMGGYLTITPPSTAKVPDGAWHHVACTNDGQNYQVFLDGVQVVAGPFGSGVKGGDSDFQLGRTGTATGFLPGQLAHLRVYDNAQDVLGLRRDMAADGVAAEDLDSRPFDFTLLNDDQQAVLYIDEAATGQAMTLRLTNTSKYTIEFPEIGAPDATTHHFALRLRKGTLAAGLTVLPADPSTWAMSAELDETALYFQWKKPVPLAPGATLELRLTGLNADGAAGTRGTRVELTYQGLHYSGETDELAGSRMRHLDVVNSRGRRDLPVDLRLVGGDRVLSDGASASTVTLHLTNELRDGTGVALSAAVPVSAFTVSFDVQESDEDRPWALTDTAKAAGVTLTATDATRWNVQPEPLGQQAMWTVTPRSDTVLAPGEAIELTMGNIVALPSEGHAPIVVDYRNVPGFADGLMTVPVERSLLITTSTGVGIGVAPPQAQLHVGAPESPPTDGSLVVGWLNTTSVRLGRQSDRAWIQSHGPAPLSINPYGGYHVGVGDGLPAAQLHVLTSGTQNPGDAAALWVGSQSGAKVQIGQGTATGWIQSSTGPLALNPNGNWVAVGSGTPQGKMHILSDDQEPTGPPALVISAATGPGLRLGHNAAYSWVQSQNGPMALNPTGNQVTVGPNTGQTHAGEGRLTVSSTDKHLQLRRESRDGAAAGRLLFLDLFQDDTTGTQVTHPVIRFGHSGHFSYRIEVAPDGFWFQNGDFGSEDMADVHGGLGQFSSVSSSGTGTFGQLRIGGTVIGEHELQVLLKLAAGQLQFDLYNAYQDEYAYAADYHPYDDDRRYVWTWRPKGTISQGVWRIDNPRW